MLRGGVSSFCLSYFRQFVITSQLYWELYWDLSSCPEPSFTSSDFWLEIILQGSLLTLTRHVLKISPLSVQHWSHGYIIVGYRVTETIIRKKIINWGLPLKYFLDIPGEAESESSRREWGVQGCSWGGDRHWPSRATRQELISLHEINRN